MTDRQVAPRRAPYNAGDNARRAQTPVTIPNKPAWLSRYQTISDVGGVDEDYSRLSDLVGRVLLVSALEDGHSRENGPFVRLYATEIDPQTGEIKGDPSLVISFSQVPNRIFNRLAGGRIDGRFDLNPAFVCRVDVRGDVVLLVDP